MFDELTALLPTDLPFGNPLSRLVLADWLEERDDPRGPALRAWVQSWDEIRDRWNEGWELKHVPRRHYLPSFRTEHLWYFSCAVLLATKTGEIRTPSSHTSLICRELQIFRFLDKFPSGQYEIDQRLTPKMNTCFVRANRHLAKWPGWETLAPILDSVSNIDRPTTA